MAIMWGQWASEMFGGLVERHVQEKGKAREELRQLTLF